MFNLLGRNFKINATPILWLCIVLYISYFSYFTVLRYQTLYASYFDLGIMHQTVFNTYQAISSFDFSRILELTNPFGPEQIKRMAIHNDLLLFFFSFLYFLHDGPQTLLIAQTVILAIGSFFIFKITQRVFEENKQRDSIAFVFSLSYLLYPPMQRANMYDFHAVTFATTGILAMYYFWFSKRYGLSFLFLILSLLAKEQVALTVLFFGLYTIYDHWKEKKGASLHIPKYSYFVIGLSLFWFILSIFYIIPFYRGGHHFALGYYGDFGDSPAKILIGIFQHPMSLAKYVFHVDTLRYFLFTLGPVGFLSLFSFPHLLVAIPEYAINLLSNSWHMRNIVFHYTAVIQPIVFIASIHGARNVLGFFIDRFWMRSLRSLRRMTRGTLIVILYLGVMTALFAYFKGPLPYSSEQEIHPFKYPQKEYTLLPYWQKVLQSDSVKVSSTGQLAPYFSSRRYFYIFSSYYPHADYIVLRLSEIYNYPESPRLIPIYEQLQSDKRFEKIYTQDGLEVYKKVIGD